MKCDLCGIEVKNLGAHKYQKHRDAVPEVVDQTPAIEVDNHIPDKQLSFIVSELKNILRQYSYSLTVKTVEQNGTNSEVEIVARIQPRR